MTRCAVDVTTVLTLIEHGTTDTGIHRLVAPNLLRSQVLATVLDSHRTGTITAAGARARLEDLARLPIRLLGDRVSRRRAFDLAVEHGLSAATAEYLAVAQLQADVLITTDHELIIAAGDSIPISSVDLLL